MKVKISELEGDALERLVAKCEGKASWIRGFTTEWEKGGPIIERERMTLDFLDGSWRALILEGEQIASDGEGPTPLIAAMRCFVSYRLGSKVEILEELTALKC